MHKNIIKDCFFTLFCFLFLFLFLFFFFGFCFVFFFLFANLRSGVLFSEERESIATRLPKSKVYNNGALTRQINEVFSLLFFFSLKVDIL